MDVIMQCILCKASSLEVLKLPKYNNLVTGDRKVFHGDSSRVKMVICKECGHLQHLQDRNYKEEIDQIYYNYAPNDVKTFNETDKSCIPRLKAVCQKVCKAVELPRKGNMLDIGCACGEALRYFHELKPEWHLFGVDTGEHFRDDVLRRDQVKGFYSNIYEVKASKIKFDFIMINYVLGVCDNIMDILGSLYELLNEQGIVFVIETDFVVQPYQLNIAEQISFFHRDSLAPVLTSVGLEIIDTDFQHEEKEIWAFARKGISKESSNIYDINKHKYNKCLDYLNRVGAVVENVVMENKNSVVGVFGISNAGVWISEIICKTSMGGGKNKIFFVDEDEEMVSRRIGENEFPIYRVEEITEEAVILLPFPQYIANRIKKRYEKQYSYLRFLIL